MKFQTIRRFFYEIHLWLGIASGILVFTICLSGVILLFQDDVRYLAEPTRYYVQIPNGVTRQPIDSIVESLEKEHKMRLISVTIPEKADRTWKITLTKGKGPQYGTGSSQGGHGGSGGLGLGLGLGRQEKQGQTGQPPGKGPGRDANQKDFYVDPYTGKTVAEGGNVVDPFFRSMMLLHRFLWLPQDIGRPVVGVTTLIFVAIVLSGFVLWLPKSWAGFAKWKSWKIGLAIRVRKGFWRFIYDIHNTIGFYTLIPVLLMALTGLCWSFEWYRNGASQLLGDQVFKQRMLRPAKIEPNAERNRPLAVGEIVALQTERAPNCGDITVRMPIDPSDVVIVQTGKTGFFAVNAKDKTEWDRFRGKVVPVEHDGKMVDVERFADKPFGAKIASLIKPIHLGDVTGTSSKILFFIACVFATSFPITGVMMWIKKLRAKRKNVPHGEFRNEADPLEIKQQPTINSAEIR